MATRVCPGAMSPGNKIGLQLDACSNSVLLLKKV